MSAFVPGPETAIGAIAEDADLKHLRENAVEAGRLIDIADRRLYDILLKMTKAENSRRKQK